MKMLVCSLLLLCGSGCSCMEKTVPTYAYGSTFFGTEKGSMLTATSFGVCKIENEKDKRLRGFVPP